MGEGQDEVQEGQCKACEVHRGPHEVCGHSGRTAGLLLGMIRTNWGVVGRSFGQGQRL